LKASKIAAVAGKEANPDDRDVAAVATAEKDSTN
jgi:hypothetical protein